MFGNIVIHKGNRNEETGCFIFKDANIVALFQKLNVVYTKNRSRKKIITIYNIKQELKARMLNSCLPITYRHTINSYLK